MEPGKMEYYWKIDKLRITKHFLTLLIAPILVYGFLVLKQGTLTPFMLFYNLFFALVIGFVAYAIYSRVMIALKESVYTKRQNTLLKNQGTYNAFEANAALHKLVEDGDRSAENLEQIELLLPRAEYGSTLFILRSKKKSHNPGQVEGLTNTGETVSTETTDSSETETVQPTKGKIGNYHLLGCRDWVIIRNTMDVYEPKYLGTEDEEDRFPFLVGIRWDMSTGKILEICSVGWDPGSEVYVIPLGTAIGRLVAVKEDESEIRLPLLFAVISDTI